MNPETTEPCYVILRSDGEATLARTTIKLVTWTKEEADAQVERLNKLNAAKGCRYYWEISRALRRPQI